MFDLLVLFAIGAFVGWIGEVLYCGLRYGNWQNRGFLHLPLTPMYGFATIFAHITIRPFLELSTNIAIIDNILLFIYSFILCAVIEFTVGWLLKTIFKTTWWDYTGRLGSIGGYICLEMSIIFGVVGFIVLKLVYFPMINFIHGLNHETTLIFIVIFYLAVFIDLIITVIELIDYAKLMNNLNKQLKKLQKGISDDLDIAKENINDTLIKVNKKRLHLQYFVKSRRKHGLISKIDKLLNK